MILRSLQAARHEFADAILFYLDRSPSAAAAFVEEIDSAFVEIAESPLRHPIRYKKDVRKKVLVQFPYSIAYKVFESEVLVIAVPHHSREPEYWLDRLA